jgi:hypothetical protein
MPVRAGQILVRTPSLEALATLLGRALRRQKVAPGSARTLAVLFQAGWACVLERGRVDFGLSRLLSEDGGEAHALELDGARFFLKLRSSTGGEPGPLRQEPVDAGPLLPVVCDVEQEAWDFLRALGVPPALRLCTFEDVRLFEPGDAESTQSGLEALRLTLTGAGTETGLQARLLRGLPPERSEGLSPPARPDSLVESKAGESLALEVRKLPGLVPTPEAADALAAVEEQAALRLCLELGPLLEQERLPRPAFAYETQSLPDLLPLLDEAREARPWLTRLCHPGVPAPLSHAGFALRSRALLAAAVPDARVLRIHGLSLEVRHPGAPDSALLVDLAPRWQAVLLGEETEPDPAQPGAPSPLVDEVDQRLREPLLALADLPRSAFLAGLLPTLLSAGDAAWFPGAPLVPSLPGAAPAPPAGLLCDASGQLRPVDARALATHGLTFEAALARAVENVDARTLASPGGLHLFDLDHGRVAMTSFDDTAGAGRLASASFRALLLQLLGPEVLVAAPTRDTLLACPESEEGAAWLEGEAGQRRSEGPFPLPGPLFSLTEAGLRVTTARGPGQEK